MSETLIVLIKIVCALVWFLLLTLYLTWVERKESALIQDRIGANRAKILGLRIIDKGGLSKTHDTLVSHSPSARILSSGDFMIDIKLETDLFVILEDLYFLPLVAGVEIEDLVPVAEVEGDDIGGIPVRKSQATDQGAIDDGFNGTFFGDSLFFLSHGVFLSFQQVNGDPDLGQ